jgi:hypothetical protein
VAIFVRNKVTVFLNMTGFDQFQDCCSV